MSRLTWPSTQSRGRLRHLNIWEVLAGSGITILAVALRWHAIDFQSLWLDEAAAVSFASQSPRGIIALTFATEPNPPLYYLILHFWMNLAGQSEFALRSLFAFAGAASVPLLYLIGRRLFNPLTGLLGALVLAINPLHIWLSQETRTFALLALAGLAALYFLIRFLESPGWRYGTAYAVCLFITFYLHVYGLLLLLAFGAIAFLRQPGRENVSRLALASAGPLLLYLPWLLTLPQHIGTTQWRPTLGLADTLSFSLRTLTLGEDYFWSYTGDWWLLWVGLAVLGPHLVADQRRRRSALVVLAWFGVPLLASYLISFVTPIFWPHYLVVVAPALPGHRRFARRRRSTPVASYGATAGSSRLDSLAGAPGGLRDSD